MVRLYLFAEGQTEQTFASTVLMPHLANFGVYMHNPVLIAHARKKGHVYRGGGRNYDVMKNDIIRFLKQEPDKDVFFTTMIDLYALHVNFPGRLQSERLRSVPYQRVEFLEQCFSADVGDPRFIPFIQLHEYEAILFADISQLTFFYDDPNAKVCILQKVTDKIPPEMINDGSQTAPSKRIIEYFPEYKVNKSTVGVQAAERIGLENICLKCPHFAAWLHRLENLK